MINVNVFSEEKAWSKKLRNKELFFREICKAFPKKYKFIGKKINLTILLSNNKNIIDDLLMILVLFNFQLKIS